MIKLLNNSFKTHHLGIGIQELILNSISQLHLILELVDELQGLHHSLPLLLQMLNCILILIERRLRLILCDFPYECLFYQKRLEHVLILLDEACLEQGGQSGQLIHGSVIVIKTVQKMARQHPSVEALAFHI